RVVAGAALVPRAACGLERRAHRCPRVRLRGGGDSPGEVRAERRARCRVVAVLAPVVGRRYRLPVTPFRRRIVGREVQSHGLDWVARSDDAATAGTAPTFTIVVPVWNTDPDALRALFRSVRAQRYDARDMS